jgi:hypothetical protein
MDEWAVRGQAAADIGDRRHAHRIATVAPMLERPAPQAARRILDLARTDRDAAQRALAAQAIDAQVELVSRRPSHAAPPCSSCCPSPSG